MSTKTKAVRVPRSTAVLWGWTFVSTILHAVLIGGLCGWSYLGHAKEEAAAKAKTAAEEQAAAKAEADAAAKASAEKPPAPPASTSGEKPPASTTSTQGSGATPKQPDILPPPKEPGVASPGAPPSAEKILGIDGTARPGETPKSPFAGGTDDLLKDLK